MKYMLCCGDWFTTNTREKYSRELATMMLEECLGAGLFRSTVSLGRPEILSNSMYMKGPGYPAYFISKSKLCKSSNNSEKFWLMFKLISIKVSINTQAILHIIH